VWGQNIHLLKIMHPSNFDNFHVFKFLQKREACVKTGTITQNWSYLGRHFIGMSLKGTTGVRNVWLYIPTLPLQAAG
jgi:hypothetical protein